MNFDRFFKVGLLIIGIGFLLVYSRNASLRQAQYVPLGANPAILDTKNGTVFIAGEGSWQSMQMTTGELTKRPIVKLEAN